MKQVLLLALLLTGLLFGTATVSAQESGYTYTVQPDDNWGVVAQEVGLTVEQLQDANPQAIRPTTWLIVGEELFIPSGPAQFYTVQAGDGWTTIAAEFDLSVRLLQATNAEALRPNGILLVGERLLIPPTSATLSTIATATQTPTATLPAATATPTTVPSETPTSTPTIANLAGLPPCPAATADLGQTLAVVFNRISGERQGKVAAFLASCGFKLKHFVTAALNGDQAADAVLVYTSSDAALDSGEGLVLLNGGPVYAVGYTAPALGAIELLTTQDINADGQTDVVWSDTTCGASACFVTVHIRSWDGSIWQDWTEGTISMASADLTLTSGDRPGTPKEIRLAGGLYSGAMAGPQRIRTAVWSSVDGAPYTLTAEILGTSACLYHTVLDANRVLTDEQDLEKAQLLYTTALENTKLVACWVRQNELSELRSFALFRLALTAGYMDDLTRAAAYVQQLESEYAEQIFTDVARLWLDTYQQTADPIRACSAVRDFAAVTPSIVDVLADYGYANPTFTVEEVCPPPPPIRPTSTPTASTQTPRAGTRPTPTSLAIELPNCPQTSVEYTLTLPVVVNRVAGDLLSIDAWLRICGALTDERGSLQIYDLSGDGLDDIIIMPTIISDVGYGPNGADGIIVILHQQQDGSYQKAYEPNVYGQPHFLAIGDVNEDGKPELIWQSDSCSTFCISSVWAIVWDSTVGVYRDVITPGAAIAEGTVIVEVLDVEDPTNARRLRFVGGVSGTRAGGLAVPHTEIWYSLEGAPFRRFSWMYDRASAGNDCFGLRLVEADIALQTADVVGYDRAIRLYTLALASSDLQPCSLYGMDPTEEMALLQGLASFRLLQALRLNDNRAQSQSILELLVQEQPQSKFTEAASKWLASYTETSDPATACALVTPIFKDNPTLWQITTQFGYDHPSLAAQQICYVPPQ